MINFEATKEDTELIIEIAKKAVKISTENGGNYKLMDAQMDVCAVHLNDCKLKLKDLLEADDFNFAHDIFGIRQHIDRSTGKLQNCFLPRFAAPIN